MYFCQDSLLVAGLRALRYANKPGYKSCVLSFQAEFGRHLKAAHNTREGSRFIRDNRAFRELLVLWEESGAWHTFGPLGLFVDIRSGITYHTCLVYGQTTIGCSARLFRD